MKATALVEYTASSPQEISLQQGAIVHVLSKGSGTWWLAECNGHVGYIPPSYVEVLPESEQQPILTAVAIYAHEASNPREIEFFQGERVKVLEYQDPEWWYGVLDSPGTSAGDKTAGYFAKNYVSVVNDSEPPELASRRIATIRTVSPKLPARPLAQAPTIRASSPFASAPPPLPVRVATPTPKDLDTLAELARERERAMRLEAEAARKQEEMTEMLRKREAEMLRKEAEMQERMRQMEESLREKERQLERERLEREAEVARAQAEAEAARREAEQRAEQLAAEAEQRRLSASEPVAASSSVAASSLESSSSSSADADLSSSSPASISTSTKATTSSKTPSKFDAKPKAKFVSGPVKRTKKPASKYGVAVCEDKYAVKSLNNIDESLGHK